MWFHEHKIDINRVLFACKKGHSSSVQSNKMYEIVTRNMILCLRRLPSTKVL